MPLWKGAWERILGWCMQFGWGSNKCINWSIALRALLVESEKWSWNWCYGSMDIFLDPHTNWIHQPNVLPKSLSTKASSNSLWRSAYPILWSNPILLRYLTKIAPLCSLALRLRNTKVTVWTHESIGYPKMDISHWDAAIHYGVQLAQYCDPTLSCYAISRRLPPLCSLALRLRNTKVPVWTDESIGYPKMDISHWDAAIHYGVQLAQYCDQTRSFNAISRRSPPVYSLALRLRNTKVPVWTHESIGYPKMDISHWDAAIHYGIQLAQYCDPTLSLNAISRRSPPVYSLAL